MAHSHQWSVEHIRDGVKVELCNENSDHMRLSREGKTVELRVDDDGVAEVVGGGEVPVWTQNVAARLGVYEVR